MAHERHADGLFMFDLHFHDLASWFSGFEITCRLSIPVMQPGWGRRSDLVRIGRAKSRGRNAEGRPERAGERFVALVASVKGDARDWRGTKLELTGGPFQPQSADVLLHRFPHHALEDAIKMIRRETSQTG